MPVRYSPMRNERFETRLTVRSTNAERRWNVVIRGPCVAFVSRRSLVFDLQSSWRRASGCCFGHVEAAARARGERAVAPGGSSSRATREPRDASASEGQASGNARTARCGRPINCWKAWSSAARGWGTIASSSSKRLVETVNEAVLVHRDRAFCSRMRAFLTMLGMIAGGRHRAARLWISRHRNSARRAGGQQFAPQPRGRDRGRAL